MNARLTITAAVTTAALAATLGLTPAASAATAGVPGLPPGSPVMTAHVTGWAHMVRTPADIEIGQGGSPYITGLLWSHWDSTWAGATGTLHTQRNPHCTPNYKCPYATWNVKVWMHRVITHRGTKVFSAMRWTYGRAGHVLRLRLSRGYWDYTS